MIYELMIHKTIKIDLVIQAYFIFKRGVMGLQIILTSKVYNFVLLSDDKFK